jgi:hypothetical protein
MNATDTTPINYTISADGGLARINVYSHTSDFETRMLPLQWALDQVSIALTLFSLKMLIIYLRQLSSLDLDREYPLLWNGHIIGKPTNNRPRIRDLVHRFHSWYDRVLTRSCLRLH